MKRLVAAVLLAGLTMPAASAWAQQGTTVASLLKDGYEVKAASASNPGSNAGPGIVLQKGGSVIMCFVAETPKSAAIVTQYCKPVQ
jgi:hypothetical protein